MTKKREKLFHFYYNNSNAINIVCLIILAISAILIVFSCYKCLVSKDDSLTYIMTIIISITISAIIVMTLDSIPENFWFNYYYGKCNFRIHFPIYYKKDYYINISQYDGLDLELCKILKYDIKEPLDELYKMAMYSKNTEMLYIDIRPQIYKLYQTLNSFKQIMSNELVSSDVKEIYKQNFINNSKDIHQYILNLSKPIEKQYNYEYNLKITNNNYETKMIAENIDDVFLYIKKYNELLEPLQSPIFKEETHKNKSHK